MRSRYALLFGIALAAGSAIAAPPARVEITYEIQRNGTAVGEIVTRLEHDGKTYRIAETWKGKGLLAMRGDIKRASRGTVAAGGLQPTEFSDERSGRDTARATFDWNAKTVTLQHKGAPQQRAIPPGAHDRLSFLYQPAFKPPSDAPLKVNVTDGRDFSDYVYQPGAVERLKTPAGEFDALKLTRQRSEGDRGTEIWLARDRAFLPVRILLIEKDGTRLDQVATRVNAS
jgi:hypothetical protein